MKPYVLSLLTMLAVLFNVAPARARSNGITVENLGRVRANVIVRNATGRTLWSGSIPSGNKHVVKDGCSGGCKVRFQWATGDPMTGNQICETTLSNQAPLSKIAQSDVPDNMLAVFDGDYDSKTRHCSIKRRR